MRYRACQGGGFSPSLVSGVWGGGGGGAAAALSFPPYCSSGSAGVGGENEATLAPTPPPGPPHMTPGRPSDGRSLETGSSRIRAASGWQGGRGRFRAIAEAVLSRSVQLERSGAACEAHLPGGADPLPSSGASPHQCDQLAPTAEKESAHPNQTRGGAGERPRARRGEGRAMTREATSPARASA